MGQLFFKKWGVVKRFRRASKTQTQQGLLYAKPCHTGLNTNRGGIADVPTNTTAPDATGAAKAALREGESKAVEQKDCFILRRDHFFFIFVVRQKFETERALGVNATFAVITQIKMF